MNKQLWGLMNCKLCLLILLFSLLSCNLEDTASEDTAFLDSLNSNLKLSELSEKELIGICQDIRSERQNIYQQNPDGMCRRIAFHSNLVWEGASDDLEACENIVEDCKNGGSEYVFIDNCTDPRRLDVKCDVKVGYLKSCIESRRLLLKAAVSDATETNASCEIRAEGFEGWPESFYDYSDHPDACEDIHLDDSCGLILGTFDRYADDLG